MIEIALVSYINTRPFLDGLTGGLPKDFANLHLLPPAECARALQENRVQMALLPVGAIPGMGKINLMPHFCIGARGAVESVMLFSEQPIEKLDTVLLDRHSRSSNGLVRILMQHHWKKAPQYQLPDKRDFSRIKGKTGGVIIGDEAIRLRHTYPYSYDLSEAWFQLTGLPFAFAVWAYRPGSISPEQSKSLTNAFRLGVSRVDSVARRWAKEFGMDVEYARHYLSECIDYRFDQGKQRAVALFLRAIEKLPEIHKSPALST